MHSAETQPLQTARPPFGTTRRDYVYLRLREGPVSHRELAEAGIPMPYQHVESLRGEGHTIGVNFGTNAAGLPTSYFELIHDAWAEAGMAA
jgi:hypothetical protein